MSLVEDKLIELNEASFIDVEAAIKKWQHFPASTISHHGRRCCRVAREWLFSMDYSQLNGESSLAGPRWLRRQFAWGPSPWPISWCEVVERKVLDCGALAALAHEINTARGLRSFPTQFIQQYSLNATRQWSSSWEADNTPVNWIKEDLIYHEGCALIAHQNEIKIWDPSASWWVNPKQFGGYGRVIAIRVFADMTAGSPDNLIWGKHHIIPNQWQKIETARADFA